LQEATQVQAEIDECDKQIAALIHQKKAAEAKRAEILRANEIAAQTYLERLDAAILSIEAFQTKLAELKRHENFEQVAREECEGFLVLIRELRAKQKIKNKPNYRVVAESAALIADLVLFVQEIPTNFEKIHRQYQAIEAYAHRLDEGRPSRRKLGLLMRSAGAALIILGGLAVLAAAVSFVVCPVLAPTTLILIGMGAGLGFFLGLHMRSTGKSEIEGAKPDPQSLPHRLLLFGDALKDKVTRRGADKISVFEDYRRRWFR
jgi:hypothetical protein